MGLFEKKNSALKYAEKLGKHTAYLIVNNDNEVLEVLIPENYINGNCTVFKVVYKDGEYIATVYN